MLNTIRLVRYQDGSILEFLEHLLEFRYHCHFLSEQELLEHFFLENFELQKSTFAKIFWEKCFENSDRVKINQFLDSEEIEVFSPWSDFPVRGSQFTTLRNTNGSGHLMLCITQCGLSVHYLPVVYFVWKVDVVDVLRYDQNIWKPYDMIHILYKKMIFRFWKPFCFMYYNLLTFCWIS